MKQQTARKSTCRWLVTFLVVLLLLAGMGLPVFADVSGTENFMSGLTIGNDTVISGTGVEWTVIGQNSIRGCATSALALKNSNRWERSEGSITLTNTTGQTKELEISFSKPMSALLVFSNNEEKKTYQGNSTAGVYSGVFSDTTFEAGETLTISYRNETTATNGTLSYLYLTDITLAEPGAKTITFLPDPAGLSTYTVGETQIAPGSAGTTVADVNYGNEISVTYNSSTKDGMVLGGWHWKSYDENGSLTNEGYYSVGEAAVKPEGTTTLQARATCTVEPIFVYAVYDSAPLRVGGNYWWDWETAFAEAAKSDKKVVQVNDFVLPGYAWQNGMAGETTEAASGTYVTYSGMLSGQVSYPVYHVPEGFTYLLPWSDNSTNIETGTESDDLTYANYTHSDSDMNTDVTYNGTSSTDRNVLLNIKNVRTLQVEGGGKLVVGGAIAGEGYAGACVGKRSNIALGGDIRLKSGSVFSAVGYVYGSSGEIIAESGSEIYTPFVVYDYYGGGYTASAANTNNSEEPYLSYYAAKQSSEEAIAPFLRYGTHSLKTNVTMEQGAYMYGYVDMYAGLAERLCIVKLVGDDDQEALIKLAKGATLTASYDSGTYACATECNSTGGHSNTCSYRYVGRTTLAINGGGSMGIMKMHIEIGTYAQDVDMSVLAFPVPYNYNIRLTNGTYSIPYSMLLLPGATMEVGTGAVLNIGDGTDMRFMVYDGLYDQHFSTGDKDLLSSFGSGYQAVPFHYPRTNDLTAGDLSGTGQFIVNGELNIAANVKFGGLIQTTGTGLVNTSESMIAGCDSQIGLMKSADIGTEYDTDYFCGASVATLPAQLMMSAGDNTLTTVTPGWTYRGTYTAETDDHTLASYTHDYYIDGYSVSGNVVRYTFTWSATPKTTAKTLNAAVYGTWSSEVEVTIKYIVDGKEIATETKTLNKTDAALGVYFIDAGCTTQATVETLPEDEILYCKTVAKVDWAAEEEADTFCATLQEAVDAAVNAGDKVVILDNITLTAPVTVAEGQNITIDVNGCTVENTSTDTKAGGAVIINNGTLTLTGTEGDRGTGGTLKAATVGVGYDVESKFAATVSNYGTLSVSNITMEHAAANSAVLLNCAGGTVSEIKDVVLKNINENSQYNGICNFGTIGSIDDVDITSNYGIRNKGASEDSVAVIQNIGVAGTVTIMANNTSIFANANSRIENIANAGSTVNLGSADDDTGYGVYLKAANAVVTNVGNGGELNIYATYGVYATVDDTGTAVVHSVGNSGTVNLYCSTAGVYAAPNSLIKNIANAGATVNIGTEDAACSYGIYANAGENLLKAEITNAGNGGTVNIYATTNGIYTNYANAVIDNVATGGAVNIHSQNRGVYVNYGSSMGAIGNGGTVTIESVGCGILVNSTAEIGIESIGASGDVYVIANGSNHAVQTNTDSTIGELGKGLHAAYIGTESKKTVYAGADQITLVSGGDYYNTNGRASLFSAGEANVNFADGYALSTETRDVDFNGTTYACYYLTSSAAKVVSGETETWYGTLQDAVDAATNSGDKVVVLTDLTLDAAITVAADQNITIDLNGHKITSSAEVLNLAAGGTLVLTDASTNGGGTLESTLVNADGNTTASKYPAVIRNSGTLTVLNVKILQKTTAGRHGIYLASGAEIVYLDNVTIDVGTETDGYGIYMLGGTIEEIRSIDITAYSGVVLWHYNSKIDKLGTAGSTVNIDVTQYGVQVYGNAEITTLGELGSTVNITSTKSYGVLVNASSGRLASIGTISSVTINSSASTGIYVKAYGSVGTIGGNVNIVANIGMDVRGTVGTIGTFGKVRINASSDGISMQDGTIDTIGYGGYVEIIAQKPIFGYSNKTNVINGIYGGTVLVCTGADNRYAVNTANIPGIIFHGGYFYHINGNRDNTIQDPDNANGNTVYADGFYLSGETKYVELMEPYNGNAGYDCYYITHTEHDYQAVVTAPTCTEAGYTTYTCSCGDSYVEGEVAATGHSYADGVCTVCGAQQPAQNSTMVLRYDDRITGDISIVNPGAPTSYQVGYGVAEGTKDTAVVTLEGNTLIATGIGTATVTIDGTTYDITVEPAPISLLLVIGQSNAEGIGGKADQSIVCPDGMVYSTYGDYDDLSTTTARSYVASALTGTYSNTNLNGTTDFLSGHPINSLTEAGAGKKGMDSGIAYEWVQQTGEKVWIVNAAHSGTKILQWQQGNSQYSEAVALFQACQEVLTEEIAAGHYTLSHMGYLWCQGCSDASTTGTNVSDTAEEYVTSYLAMHEALKTDLAFDHDGDGNTAAKTFEFAAIIPVRGGSSTAVGYRDGVFAETDEKYNQSFQDLRFTGPRLAQYWMGNNPELTDIWNVCTIGDQWVYMPDGTDGVSAYFQSRYENGTVNYTTQVEQDASWYTPTTPAAVHPGIHYAQIGYNEIGREAARNTLIMLGETEAPEAETTVKFLSWDGYTPVSDISALTEGQSGTLVVPVVNNLWDAKNVTYSTTDGLTYSYYDLLASTTETTGTLTASGATGSVKVHSYTVTFAWAEDLSTCTATFTCACCGETKVECAVAEDPSFDSESQKFINNYVATAKLNGTEATDTKAGEEVPAVAKVVWAAEGESETYYATLQDAVDAAVNSGDKVVVLEDLTLTETVTVAVGQDIIIDLNGHTISNSTATTLLNNGTLTLTGSTGEAIGSGGTIICGATGVSATDTAAAVKNTGTLTISNISLLGDPNVADYDCHAGLHNTSSGKVESVDNVKIVVRLKGNCFGINNYGEITSIENADISGRWAIQVRGTGSKIGTIGASGNVNIIGYSTGIYLNNGTIGTIGKKDTIGTSSNAVTVKISGQTGIGGAANSGGTIAGIYDGTVVVSTVTSGYAVDTTIVKEVTFYGGYYCNQKAAADVVRSQTIRDPDDQKYPDGYKLSTDTISVTLSDDSTIENCYYVTASHVHEYEAVVTEPTCTEKGYTTYSCACGDSYVGDEVAALGHTEVTDEAVDATCTEAGKTEGKHCSVCGEVLVAQTVVDALGHTDGEVVVENNVNPTCTVDGSYDNVTYCTVCGVETSREHISVETKGHTAVVDEAVASTCTATGLTEGSHCSVCKEVLVAQTIVAATGHAWDDEFDTECNNGCGENRDAETYAEYITANGDTHGTITAEGAVVTIKVDGTVYHNKGTGAGYGYWIGFKITAPDGIDATKIIITRPDGNTRVLANIKDGSNPVYAHMYYNLDAATGRTAEYKIDWNNDGVTDLTVKIDGTAAVLAHKYTAVVTDPTCTEEGYTTYTCGCGETYVDNKVAALGHEWVDATFEVPKTCSVCGATEGEALVAVAKIGEQKYQTLSEAVAAAKDHDTVTLLSDSTGAGVVIDKDITIDFGTHTYTVNSAVGSAGTETLGFQILKGHDVVLKNGTLTSTAVTSGKEVKMLIQNYSDLTLTDMNLVDNTEHILYCLSNNSGNIALNGNTSITTDAVAFDVYDYSAMGYAVPKMTVNTTGAIKGGIEVSDTATLAISGGTFTVKIEENWCAEGYGPSDLGNGNYGVHKHEYGSVVTAPTCTEKGYTTYTCTVCGDSYTADEVTALGHSYGEPNWSWTGSDAEDYTAATATFACSCGDAQTVTDSDIEVKTTDATYEAAGSIVYTASVTFNGKEYTATKTVEIPMLTGTTVNFVNYTASGDYQASITVDGAEVEYQKKTEVSAILGADGTFTVYCARACIVAYSMDGENYTEVLAVDNGDGSYSFTIETPEDGMTVAVVHRGDVDLNGAVNVNDAARVQRYSVSMTTTNAKITNLGLIAADVDGKNGVNVNDAARIQRNAVKMTTNNAKISWHTK